MVKRHSFQEGAEFLWDNDPVGLGVRAYQSGTKSYVLNYRTKEGRRKRLMVLGRTNVLTLDQARDAAKDQLQIVNRDSGDPVVDRKRAAKAETFKELGERYIKHISRTTGKDAKYFRKTWKTSEGRLKRHIPTAWNSMTPSAITEQDVQQLHTRLSEATPYEANRVVDLLSVVFKFGRIEPNPAAMVEKNDELSRDRYATPKEVKRIAKAIDTEPNIYVRALIWLYLLTGARKSELLPRRHTDVDWDRKVLRLPDTKSGKPQDIPLSDEAVAVLTDLPRQKGNPYLFPGAKKGKYLVNIDKPWRRIREKAKVPDLHLHDLRRTVGSWLSQGGVELNSIKGTLRHANIATTLIYTQLGEQVGRKPLEQHGKEVMKVVGGRLRLVNNESTSK